MNWSVEDCGYKTPCWIWTGQLNDRGYGLATKATSRLAHRLVWIEHNGPLPNWASELDHLCRVRACVNPDHLEPVTHKENMVRGYLDKLAGPNGDSPIYQARRRLGLSQNDAGRRLGVSGSMVGLWERGRYPTPDALDTETLSWRRPYGQAAVKARRPKVRTMYEAGMQVAAIAKALGVSRGTVATDIKWWRQHGLSLPPRNPAFQE